MTNASALEERPAEERPPEERSAEEKPANVRNIAFRIALVLVVLVWFVIQRQAEDAAQHKAELFGRATSLAFNGDFEESLAFFERLAELNPESHAVQNNVALLLGKVGRLEEAAAAIEEAIRLRPALDDAEVVESPGQAALLHANHGIILAHLDRHAEAVDAFGAALDIWEDHPEANYNLACSLVALERYEEAVTAFDRAIPLIDAVPPQYRAFRQTPDTALGVAGRGYARMKLGRAAEALEDYQRALELQPGSEEYERIVDELQDVVQLAPDTGDTVGIAGTPAD